MGITRDYLKFVSNGVCNVVGSADGAVQAIDNVVCAVAACENVNFFNMRTLEKTFEISKPERTVTTFKANFDRSIIAVGYDNGEVHLHFKATDREVAVFAGHRTGVNCLAFSDDGLMLASGGKDSVIVVWDVASETGLFRLNGHKGSITQLQFTKDNKHIVSSSKDFQVKFWNLASQSSFYTLTESASEVYTFALFNNDRILVIGSAEIELLVFELTWLDRDDEQEQNENFIPNLDGNKPSSKISHLVGAEFVEEQDSQANTILRCRRRGALLRQTKKRTRQIAISCDEKFFCCLGSDSLVDVFRIYTLEESQERFKKKLRKAKRKQEEVDETTAVNFESEIAKDVTLLISRIGGFNAPSKVKWVDFCKAVKIVQDGDKEYRMYCLLNDNNVHGVSLRIIKSNEVVGSSLVSLGQRGHRTNVSALSFASNSSCFVSGSAESAIVWDFNTLLPRNTLTDDSMQNITASLFSPNDCEIILGTKDGSIFIFDLAECEMIECRKKAHDEAITAIISFPQKDGFLSCGHDKQVKFWNYQLIQDFDRKHLSIKLDRILELPEEVLCASISPNRKFLVFGLLDNTARVYYTDSLKFFVSLYGHSLPVFCIDISSDSKLVVTGSGDKTVKIWGLDFGDCHKSIFAHDDTVTCVKFGPDAEEKLFWSAGKDGKLKQWDARKFNRIQCLNGHSKEIRALALTQDGRFLATSSSDMSIRLWELSEEIINLQEEEEKEREKEYEEDLMDAEDVIPGEALEKEADVASIKNIDTIKSTEQILECVDILRSELAARESCQNNNNNERQFHVLLKPYKDDCLEFFLLDVLRKVRSSYLEKTLLMVPFSYVSDILKASSKCVKFNYQIEMCSRVVLFLTKIHHNQIINSLDLLPIVDELKMTLPSKIDANLDQVGFNLAALRFCQMTLEERNKVKLFRDVSAVENEKQIKKRKGKKKVKDVAVIKV